MAGFTPDEIRKRLEKYKCDPVKVLASTAKSRKATVKERSTACDILLKYCTEKETSKSDNAEQTKILIINTKAD